MFHFNEQPEVAKLEFDKAVIYADQLREIVDLVQVAGAHGSAVNGYEAAQLNPAYDYLNKRYGSGPDKSGLGSAKSTE